uniref:WD repeat domain 90 n=1 Tax=Callorhinchus milii TaxID=7868 RepID=A0A4W3JBA1_CALMI
MSSVNFWITGLIDSLWQRPYVNIFKHFKVEEWKKSTKEGDVMSFMDRTLKATVYRIRGAIPAGNYIQLPKTTTQSLGLTGRYLYLLFKPVASKYFVVHFDAVTEDSQVIRISFSNLFKEFKSTATWLQFPFICGAAKGFVYNSTAKTAKEDLVGPAPVGVPWICLMMDLQYILSVYLNRRYSHLKNIKLCSNMLVKNIFTSDIIFEFVNYMLIEYWLVLQDVCPIPREMAFLAPKGENWHDIYDYIRFPSSGAKMPFDSIQKGQCSPSLPTNRSPVRTNPCTLSVSKTVQDRVSLIQQITSPEAVSTSPAAKSDRIVKVIPREDGGIHVFAHRGVGIAVHKHSSDEVRARWLESQPMLRLLVIVKKNYIFKAVWTKSGSTVVYPCHAIVVAMEIETGRQKFFIGHTDRVSALSFNGNTTLLASAQTGNLSVVRVWNYFKGSCLAMFRTHVHSVSCLSFSFSGAVLCGVGKDGHGKTMVVVWNTAKVNPDGEVVVMAKAHTEVDIQMMKIASFDDTRMVSCGRDNIRLWRIRSGALRSCPVNLSEYHSLEFTDASFEEGNLADKDPEDRTLFACSKSGHILEIDYKNVVIKNARRLFTSQTKHSHRREKSTFNSGPAIAINSISVSAAFCATGSDDGYLRLWPLDFSTVFLEAEHESPVSVVNIDPNGLKVLAATCTGNLGYLDISSRGYTTLMRSHTDRILASSMDGIRRHLVTVSEDGTIRVWELDSMQQFYDFVSPGEIPCAVNYHPIQQIFACGFNSGVVRIFNVENSSLLSEQRQHRGQVIGLLFSPNGEYLYSAGSLGSLALYDATEEDHHVIRLLGNVVARGCDRAPDALTVSSDGRYLAMVGPTEHIVTVMDACSLDEVMRVDVSILDLETSTLDTALKVCYAPATINQLLVTTSSNKILWLNPRTGRLIRQVQIASAIAVSEDVQYLLTAGEKVIKVWDYHMKQDTNFQVFIGHSEAIQQVAFTPDQLSVISVGDGIFIWDFLAGLSDQKETNASASSLMVFVCLSPALFAYSCGCLVIIEDLHSGSQRHLTGHVEEVSTLALSHDAQDLASASGGQGQASSCIFIWNVTSGTCKKVLSQHTTEVQAMAYSRDDRLLISVGDYRDLTIALWDTSDYVLLTMTKVLDAVHEIAFDPTTACEFACVGVGAVQFWLLEKNGSDVQLKVHRVPVPDEVGLVELTALCYNTDSVLYTATSTGKVCAWDTQYNRCFMVWDADDGEIGIVKCRGHRLMTGSNAKKVRLWTVTAVQEMRLEGTGARSSSVLLEHEMVLDGTVISAVFDDIMDMGIVGTTAGTLWYINWAENTSIRLISGHRNQVMIFSPNEGHFATCAEDGSLRVWVMQSTELVVQFQVLNQSCLCMAWSPVHHSGELLAKEQLVAGYSDGTIRLFNVLKTEMELKIHPHPVAVSAIAYSMDGEVILSGDKDGLVAISSPRTGLTVRVISDHRGSPITTIQCTLKKFDEFGLRGCEMWLSVSSDRRVSVWAADWLKDQCELIDWLTFPAPACDRSNVPPSLAAFSPSQSGEVVYVGYGVEPEIIFYSLHVKQIIRTMTLSHWATCLSISPKGHLIAVGSNERLLRLIEYPSGNFQDLPGHSDTVQFSRFTPSGKYFLSTSYNEVFIWEVQKHSLKP